MSEGICTVEGCEKPLRSRFADYCKMHYHRWYRHGSVDMVTTKFEGVSFGRRYKRVVEPSHPLANKNGQVYEHRKVLYDEIGPGPHACHWCGTAVDWLPKGTPGELQPDHLNFLGDDNRPENLVPCCRSCNTARGQQRRSDAMREAGFWSKHDTIAELRTSGRKNRVA